MVWLPGLVTEMLSTVQTSQGNVTELDVRPSLKVTVTVKSPGPVAVPVISPVTALS